MDTILKRRSVRKWLDQPVEEEKIKTILKAAMNAPSAGNQMPWEFIVVEDKAILEELSNSSPYAKCVAHAPVAIVVVYRTDDLRFPSYAQIDSAIACENILLAITELGLGGVWLGIAPEEERMEKVEKILHLENKHAFAIIPFGYSDMTLDPNDKYDEARITWYK